MFDSYAIDESDGAYLLEVDITIGWVHSVIVYHGVGHGITVYQDGSKIATDTDKNDAGVKPKGNGQVVIGIRNHGSGDDYASASVDEIKFYNRQLSEKEISDRYGQL